MNCLPDHWDLTGSSFTAWAAARHCRPLVRTCVSLTRPSCPHDVRSGLSCCELSPALHFGKGWAFELWPVRRLDTGGCWWSPLARL